VTTGTAGRGNLNHCSVARGVADMGRLPAIGVTGDTITRGTLPCGDTDPSAGDGVVTGGTGVMGIHFGADQSVIVTGGTGGAAHSNDATVNRGIHVQGIPVTGMTGRTVATGKHGLTKRQALEAAVGIVTGGTGVMGAGRCAVQGVIMTAGTGGSGNLNQVAVIRNVGDMDRIKAIGMTGGTIATGGEVFTAGNAAQAAVGVVTAAAGVMHLRITGIGQWRRIIVTGRAVGRSNLNQTRVVRSINGMVRFPRASMTGGTVTTTSWNPRLQSRNGGMAVVAMTHMGAGDRRI